MLCAESCSDSDASSESEGGDEIEYQLCSGQFDQEKEFSHVISGDISAESTSENRNT